MSKSRNKVISPTRREILKYSGAAVLSAPFVSRAWAQTTEINMLAWYGHGEPDMVAEFEEANNVKFNPKYYAGGDNMLALIAQSPAGTYDLILSDAEFVQQLNAADYIEEMNAADYPFDDMLHEDFTKFPGHWKDGKLYSMMLRGGHLGVSYNTTAISAEEAMSYKCFWKPEVKGKVGHFDWHLPSLGMMSLYNGNGSSLWDLDDAKWQAVQDTTTSLRPQVGGYFDYGGTFNSLKNGEMLAMCGIGDWITGVLEKDGAPVASVIPKEGGIQFTESYSIGKGSEKMDIVKKFIQYMMSPDGQVKSAQMAAYPGFCITKADIEAENVDVVAGLDAMGFVLGAGIATRIGRGFLPIRKAGKLCVDTDSSTFTNYSGRTQNMEMRKPAFASGTRVLLVDQWVETGGSMQGAIQLVEQQQGSVAGLVTIVMEENEATNAYRQKYPCVSAILPGTPWQDQANNQFLESFNSYKPEMAFPV